MARYYFHLKSRVPSEDGTGIELPDVAAVRTEAMRFAGELMKVYRRMDRYEASGDIVVTDESGEEVMTMLLPGGRPMRSLDTARSPGLARSGSRSRRRNRAKVPGTARPAQLIVTRQNAPTAGAPLAHGETPLFVVVVPHNLGKAEADRRLRSGLERVGTAFGGTLAIAEQTGDRLEFRANLLGAATRGAIDVADDHVTLTVDVPWFLGTLAEKARSLISRQGRLMLDKK